MDYPPDPFREALLGYFDDLRRQVSTENGDWTVKGFIDIYQRIYTISLDTKVLSKVLELVMFPVILKIAEEQNYQVTLAPAQNQYPDISLTSKADGTHYALDIKTTYRTQTSKDGRMRVNGMTLGTFGGYFRDRERATISTFPYNRYKKHYVLGVIYTRVQGVDERHVYEINELAQIPSVATDFEFFLHEKYRIAADRAGSGNTRNIGSTVFLDRLLEGSGVFAELGVEIFDDYWMNYRTRAMARAEGFTTSPYSNLVEYKRYKEQGSRILEIPESQIETEAFEEENNQTTDDE